jgi:uncharacterized protein (TIGR04551 family)
MNRSALVTGIALLLIMTGQALASDTPAEEASENPPQQGDMAQNEAEEGDQESLVDSDLVNRIESRLGEPEQSFPYFEQHGYFRFRADNFWNLDLGTQGTSPVLPPLEATNLAEGTAQDVEAEQLSSANLRFRYHPIVHVSNDVRLHLEFDILDNLVLGSTPAGFGFSDTAGSEGDLSNEFTSPFVAFSSGQQPASSEFTFQDSIRVRLAYAEMNFIGLLRIGRMASDWGLGILANSGGSYNGTSSPDRLSHRSVPLEGFDCMDCDYGDIVDRLMFITSPLDLTYAGFVYDWPSSGTVTYDDIDPFGQAMDLSQVDDVWQAGMILMRNHMSPEEQRARDRRLKEEHLPVIEGGLYVIYREQEADQGENAGFYPDDFYESTSVTGHDVHLYPRGASAWIPDLWLRFLWEPAFKKRLRMELELVGIFGHIDNIESGLPDEDEGGRSRDVRELGIAFESDFRVDKFTAGLNAGYASGRSTENVDTANETGWGVLDSPTITAASEVTNFKFDRDYVIDQIMFREIIGTVTNAMYINPFVQYDLFTAQESALGARLDAIYAMAPVADLTPGGDGHIGLELDTLLYYNSGNYRAQASYGVFFPFGAFDAVAGRYRSDPSGFWATQELESTFTEDVSATIAHTLQFHLMWAF